MLSPARTASTLLASLTLLADSIHPQCANWNLTTHTGAEVNASFGFSVAVSGTTAIVGEPGSSGQVGAAHILEFDGTRWVERAELRAGSSLDGQQFGYAVALAGGIAAVGAPFDGLFSADGSVAIFRRESDEWILEADIFDPSPGASMLGASVLVDAGEVLVGAPSDSWAGNKEGLVRRYAFNGASWQEVGTINAGAAASAEAQFGHSMAISGDTLIIGAPSQLGGCAFVYKQLGGIWLQQAQLVGSSVVGDEFGYSVGIAGDVCVVGAPEEGTGHVYVFERTGSLWTEVDRLSAAGSHRFGNAVDILDGQIVSGSPLTDTVYSFVPNGSGWDLAEEIDSCLVSGADDFGRDVDLAEGGLLVGAPDDDFAGTRAGALLEFRDGGAGWNEFDAHFSGAQIAVASGGTQTLHIQAGTQFAGDLYLVLGSLTGTEPGFDVGGVHIPLNPDIYLVYCVSQPNTLPLLSTFAFLDASGTAVAKFQLTPGAFPALVGSRLDHSYVVLEDLTLEVVAGSHAEPLRFVD